jgi:hypothetical protein
MTDTTTQTDTGSDAKAWYESKTIWGALITAGSLIGGIVFHKTLLPGDQQQIVDIIVGMISSASTILTIWGRFTASQPIA